MRPSEKPFAAARLRSASRFREWDLCACPKRYAPCRGRRNRANLTHMTQAASPARAWIGTIVFLFLAPGVVAGLIPWLISGWRWYNWGGAAWVAVPIAWIAIAVGMAFLLPSRCSPCTVEPPLPSLRPKLSS